MPRTQTILQELENRFGKYEAHSMTKFRFSADILTPWVPSVDATRGYDKDLERALVLCVLWDAPQLVRDVIVSRRRKQKESKASKLLGTS